MKIPVFDACVGNPPYIRHELIEHKETWNNLIKISFGIDKINQQSDLYVYYLMHTASFLKEGGRLGYVISASWLDISFGGGLQKFMMDNFKIIAILDQQKNRSFETASVNTIILILEKTSNANARAENFVKFVRIYNNYEVFVGNSNDSDRIDRLTEFTNTIENFDGSNKLDDLFIQNIRQADLEKLSTFDGKYVNGHWGAKFLRSPEIYNRIISQAGSALVPLSDIATVKYGIKSGANEFFYLIDNTDKALLMGEEEYKLIFGTSKEKHVGLWKTCGWFLSELNGQHFIIEKEYVKSIFKTQKEAKNLDVDISSLKYYILACNDSKTKLSKLNKHVLKYINFGESQEINKRPSVSSKSNWYDLTSSITFGDFIFPSKIGEKYRLIDNRKTHVCCDKVNYTIEIKDAYKEYANELFLILNSITFRYLVDLFARQLTGSQTLSDVDVNLVSKTLIINPKHFREQAGDISIAYQSIKGREQLTIHEEIFEDDKIFIDETILKSIGMTSDDVKTLYKEASKYVSDRQQKSKSLTTTKVRAKLTYEDALILIKERFSDVTKYKDLIKNVEKLKITIPDGKVTYPKDGIGSENLFGLYNIYFTEGAKSRSISFENPQQLELFEFVNKVLELKNIKLSIPKNAKDCVTVLKDMQLDYEENIYQIKSFLKSNRSKANPLSIYRELIF